MSDHPNPTLHHFNLKTLHLQEMVEWYGTVVGAKPLFMFPGGAWLSNDAANHRIAFLAVPVLTDDPDKLAHTGLHHTAFEYDSIDGLFDNYVRLKELGILPHVTVDHGMTTSFYYVDPDGNSVELQYDNFGDWSKSCEFMRSSPDFAQNPIGVVFDADKAVEARQQGASAEEIHRRAYYDREFKPTRPMDARIPLPPELHVE
ncbi:MAG: VOC family protein [Chloroflexi bacterium]|nr:VOC family protein [Chloroflexota bacterium]MBP8059909.1 VOC family protein [Chloroflexota bacterium]